MRSGRHRVRKFEDRVGLGRIHGVRSDGACSITRSGKAGMQGHKIGPVSRASKQGRNAGRSLSRAETPPGVKLLTSGFLSGREANVRFNYFIDVAAVDIGGETLGRQLNLYRDKGNL